MAKSTTISEEELQLRKRARRRLIGAIALVLLAAVFLPMLLEHEPKPTGNHIDVQIPSTEGAPPLTVQAPPADAASAPQATTTLAASEPAAAMPASTAAKPKEEPKKVETKKPALKPEAKPTTKPAEKKPAEKTETKVAAKPTSTSSSAFVVQVAALTDAAKAAQMRDQIKNAGIPVYTETVATASGKVTRVRAGPYKTRADAEKAQAKLKGIGLNGNVIPK